MTAAYKKDPNDHHRLIVDPEAAQVVKQIYSLYLQGYGCQQIAHILIAERVSTPSAYKRAKELHFENPNSGKYSVSCGMWAKNTISHMLRNEVYIGTLIQGREKKASYKSKKIIIAPKDEWVINENNHEPIIDRHAFLTVRELMQKKRHIHKPKSGYAGTAQAHLLAGKVICMDCKSTMQRSAPARNGDHYLRCGLAYKSKARAKVCTPHTIKLELLIAMVQAKVEELIKDYMADSGEMNLLKGYCGKDKDFQGEISRKEAELCLIQCRTAEISKAFSQVYLDKVNGLLTVEDYINVKNGLDLDLAALNNKQASLDEQIKSIKIKQNILKDEEELLRGYIGYQSLTHEMVNDLIDYIEVSERNESGEQRAVINWHF